MLTSPDQNRLAGVHGALEGGCQFKLPDFRSGRRVPFGCGASRLVDFGLVVTGWISLSSASNSVVRAAIAVLEVKLQIAPQ